MTIRTVPCGFTPSGGTGGVQSQHQPCEQLPEEDPAGECAVAAVRLPLLLLHTGLQSVARHLPQQEGERHVHVAPATSQRIQMNTGIQEEVIVVILCLVF